MCIKSAPYLHQKIANLALNIALSLFLIKIRLKYHLWLFCTKNNANLSLIAQIKGIFCTTAEN